MRSDAEGLARHYMYVGATLATFLLATGAKFKNR